MSPRYDGERAARLLSGHTSRLWGLGGQLIVAFRPSGLRDQPANRHGDVPYGLPTSFLEISHVRSEATADRGGE